MALTGTLRTLVLFDVAEAIQLRAVRESLGAPSEGRAPRFSRPAPEYVKFERPPTVELLEDQGNIKYYDYGVISVETVRPISGDWPELVDLTSKWISAPHLEELARKLVEDRVSRLQSALVKPYAQWLSEDYYIVTLDELPGTAAETLARYGAEIAQLVRGETQRLSDNERNEVLHAAVTYYTNDLMVVGWTAALVCDPQGIEPTLQLLEYANTQLLEFRYYDELLTRVLAEVYNTLEHGSTFFGRWRMANDAAHLNRIRLEVTELSERADNSIKFLSDMFYARVYRMAATRVGVPDYRNLVEEKLKTAGELYQFMVDQFQQARGFVLELLVVIILVIELVFLFRGKR